MKEEKRDDIIQPLNVREVFRSKAPKLSGLIPGFIFRYLEKIIHEKDMNQFLEIHGYKKNLEFIDAVLEDFNVKVIVEGEENIPEQGKYIFVSNHVLGGFDGMIIMKIISGHYKSFKFLVNDILMNIKNINSFFIPINKHGAQGQESAKQIDEAFRSDAQILTFPSGYVSRRIKGQVVDFEWKKNFIRKAVQYKRDLVPLFFEGRNSEFFYRLASIRRFFGIKLNFEMLYLVDETYKHKNKTFRLKFGQSIPWQTFDRSKTPQEWAKWVKEKVYAMNNIYNLPV